MFGEIRVVQWVGVAGRGPGPFGRSLREMPSMSGQASLVELHLRDR